MAESAQSLIGFSRLLKYGLMGLAAGVLLYAYGKYVDVRTPARSELQRLNGPIKNATKITTTRKSSVTSVRYELTMTTADRGEMKLTIPDNEVTEDQVRSLLGNRPILAEVDNDLEIYALSGNGASIVSYDATVAKRARSVANFTNGGVALGFASGLIALVGFFRARRKARIAAAPAPAAG